MAKADIWMPLYIGSYLADTTRLNTEQHGAYLLLIMDYWRSGPPPDDDVILANIVRSSVAVWRKIRPAVIGFFQIANGVWVHSRIEKELENARKNKEKAETKAAKAAEARWSKPQIADAPSIPPSSATSNALSTPEIVLEECPLPSPTPINSKTKSKAESALATRLPADWLPGEPEISFCKTERPDLQPAQVADRFRDFWIAQPGLKGRKVDWPATWRNWVRNERANLTKNTTNQSQSRHSNFDKLDYSEGIENGRIT